MHKVLAGLTVWMGHLVGAQPLLRHLIVPSGLPEGGSFISIIVWLLGLRILFYFLYLAHTSFPKPTVSFLCPPTIQEDLETTSSRRSSLTSLNRRPSRHHMHDQERPASTERKSCSFPISSLCVSNGLQKGPDHRDDLPRGMMVHDWVWDDPSISDQQGCYCRRDCTDICQHFAHGTTNCISSGLLLMCAACVLTSCSFNGGLRRDHWESGVKCRGMESQ